MNDGQGIESELSTATWRKSSRSTTNGDCVEIAKLSSGRIGVRDSKNPSGPALVFELAVFTAFLESVKAGRI